MAKYTIEDTTLSNLFENARKYFKDATINTLEKLINKLILKFTNQVPISIDTDGSIYKTLGYFEGYRLSSSGNISQQSGCVVTGFMPIQVGQSIKMAGVEWVPNGNSYSYIQFYDGQFKLLASINNYGSGADNGVSNMTAGNVLHSDKTEHNIYTDSKGITAFALQYQATADFSYIRISVRGSGKDMIVAIGEDIVE